jgi:spore coat protein U-like protein
MSGRGRWAAGALLLVGLALLVAPGGPARADITGCSVSSPGISFTSYDLIGQSAVTLAGDLDVTCTGTGSGANNVVTVDLGTGSGACVSRTMTDGGSNSLTYNIYTTSGYATVWCGAITQSYSFVFGASPQTYTFTMYARADAGQNVAPLSYVDNVTASASWFGGSSNGNVSVTETAPATCSASASSLDFGSYTGAASIASATIDITCSQTSLYSVALGGGSSLTGTTRRLAGPSSSFIGFDLFSDASRTVPWGDDTALGTSVSGTGNGTTQQLTVYGRTIAGPAPRPGSYSDTVVVTVSY